MARSNGNGRSGNAPVNTIVSQLEALQAQVPAQIKDLEGQVATLESTFKTQRQALQDQIKVLRAAAGRSPRRNSGSGGRRPASERTLGDYILAFLNSSTAVGGNDAEMVTAGVNAAGYETSSKNLINNVRAGLNSAKAEGYIQNVERGMYVITQAGRARLLERDAAIAQAQAEAAHA